MNSYALNSLDHRILQTILSESHWYNCNQLSQLIGASADAVQDRLCSWKKENKIFSLKCNKNGDLYPAYAFNGNVSLLPELKDVLNVFKGKKSNLKIAMWFASENGWLRNRRPLDVIGSDPNAVIAAAKTEITPIDHG